jgi:hypothetical protein
MRALALVLMSGIVGCANWSGRDAARMEAEARADDGRCATATVTFPSEAYDHCRRRLADQRRDKQQRELELAALQSDDRSPYGARQPEGIHRTIDPERFRCEARGEGEARLILCAER